MRGGLIATGGCMLAGLPALQCARLAGIHRGGTGGLYVPGVDKPSALLPLLRPGQIPFAVVATCFALVVAAGGVKPSRG